MPAAPATLKIGAGFIIEDTANRLFAVRDAGPGLEHCLLAIPFKKARDSYVPRAGAPKRLIRRAGCRVVTTPGIAPDNASSRDHFGAR